MNDLLKLLSRSLRPFGYHIRPVSGLNFLRLRPLERDDRTGQLTAAARTGQELKEIGATANLDKLIVTLRTCMRVNRNIDTRPRITGVPLAEHSLRCIHSLVRAVNYATDHAPQLEIEVRILDDRSDSSMLIPLNAVLDRLLCPWHFRQTGESGQGKSLYEQFDTLLQENALTYCVEDDYLHEPDALVKMWHFTKDMAAKLGAHCVLYPQEHPVLYTNHYPSYIVLGEDRHWRTIAHATHTLWTHAHIIRDDWDKFENTQFVGNRKKRKKGSESRTTNRLFAKYPGFAPMAPLATHLQFKDTVPPLYDWRPLWEQTRLPDNIQDMVPQS